MFGLEASGSVNPQINATKSILRRIELDGVNEEEAQGEEGGDFAQSSVNDNSPSKAEEDEKQGGDEVEAIADDNSLSSAEC